MKAVGNDCLICDFAQYYNIYDYETLPLQTQAVLACGLPKDSRIMGKLAGRNYNLRDFLLMALIDGVNNLAHMYARTHSKAEIEKPKSLVKLVIGGDEDSESEVQGFDSAEDFERRRQELIRR